MDIKELQNLIRFVSKSGVSEVKLKTKEFEVNIKTELSNGGVSYVQQMPYQQAHQNVTQSIVEKSTNDNAEVSNLITIKSPMIGTFYRKPSPDKEVFVSVGDVIDSNSIICVIEAMKLFNEIESEVSGKIVKILVEDSSPVEYDQPLFLVDPS